MRFAEFLKTVSGKVVLGTDGFVDEVWQVLETRVDASNYKVMEHMRRFGEIIVERGSGGIARELVRKRRICGGFTSNTGRAVGSLGIDTVLLGNFGKDRIDTAFDELGGFNIISLGEPAVCNIIEFTDGKIMLPNLENLLSFTWHQFGSLLEDNDCILDKVDVIGLGYWSNMPDFDNILQGLTNLISKKPNPPRMFFDFANVTKKTVDDLKQTLKIMGKLGDKVKMTLSLNKHEALLLFEYYKVGGVIDYNCIESKLTKLRSLIGIDEIIVHTPHFAAIDTAREGSACAAVQNFIENPVRTAGAGDSFNGGYIVSCLGNLNISQRLTIANAVSKLYLENGKPPNREQLVQFFVERGE